MKILKSHCTMGICVATLSLSLLATSCGSNTAGGALIGGVGGSMIGAVVGGSVGGPFGRDMGVLVGSLGGAAIGAGIGAAVDHAEEEQYSSSLNSQQGYEGLHNGNTSAQSNSDHDNRSLVRIDHTGDITFDSRSCTLSGSAKNALDKISTYLNGRSGDVYLYAGTDDIESRDFDFELSDSRARTVADYLIARGLSSNRIRIVALGKREPVADNSSSDGRMQNRRVEIYIAQ